ncbi:MAG: LysR family transcriptional regulator [Alphaproteobacteria bacterium]
MASVSLRIDLDPGGPDGRIGPGKIALMKAIGQTGSISAAARQLGMSYRRAWLLVDALNRLFGGALVETREGGSGGGGCALTPLGRAVVDGYDRACAATAKAAGAAIAELQSLRAGPR